MSQAAGVHRKMACCPYRAPIVVASSSDRPETATPSSRCSESGSQPTADHSSTDRWWSSPSRVAWRSRFARTDSRSAPGSQAVITNIGAEKTAGQIPTVPRGAGWIRSPPAPGRAISTMVFAYSAHKVSLSTNGEYRRRWPSASSRGKTSAELTAQCSGMSHSPGGRTRSARRPSTLLGSFDRDISGAEGAQQGSPQFSDLLSRWTTPIAPEQAKKIEILPDWPFWSGIGRVARSDPPMEVGYAVSQRLDVQLPRLKGFIDCSSHLGHLCEVEATSAVVEIEDLPDTLPGDEEHTPTEVLGGCQPDVAGLESSNEPRIGPIVGQGVVGTDGAIWHESSMTTVDP